MYATVNTRVICIQQEIHMFPMYTTVNAKIIYVYYSQVRVKLCGGT